MGRLTKDSPAGHASPFGETFGDRYPHIADWVMGGWIEVGHEDDSHSFVRALDAGGLAWEGEAEYATLESALHALDAGIAAWVDENG